MGWRAIIGLLFYFVLGAHTRVWTVSERRWGHCWLVTNQWPVLVKINLMLRIHASGGGADE